jgi:hypothetical protein
MEGALGMTKNHQNKEVFYSCGRELKRYLDTLRSKECITSGFNLPLDSTEAPIK